MKRFETVDRDQEPPLATYNGGMRHGLLNATTPFVRLKLFADEIELSSRFRILRKVIPTLRAERPEIIDVQVVVGSFGKGIRIRTTDDSPTVVFWSFSLESIVANIRKLGIKVIEDEGRFHFGHPGR